MADYFEEEEVDEGKKRGRRLLLLLFLLILILGVVFFIVSFSTTHWVQDTVNRGKLTLTPKLDSQFIYHSRHSGLWHMCFPDQPKIVLDSYPAGQIVDSKCLHVNYEVNENAASKDYSNEYWARIHLMRAQFAFFVVALLFLVIACISGAVGCWRLSSTVVKVTGLIAFIAAFFVAAGMAFFHGAEYLERNKIKTNTGEFYSEWPKVLSENTVRSYGWSYILGWIGMVFAAIAAILFLVAGYSIQSRQRKGQEKVPYDDYTMRSRNRAYDYMQDRNGPYPPAAQADEYFAQPYPAPPNYARGYEGPGYPGYYY